MKRILLLAAIFVFLFNGLSSATIVSRFVAVVNGEGITEEDLEEAMIPFLNQVENGIMPDMSRDELKRKVLESMINDKLLVQEAIFMGVEVSDVELQNQLDMLREERGWSMDEFRAQLAREDLTLDEYRERIRNQMLKNRLLSGLVFNRVMITNEEVEAFFQEHKDELMGHGGVQVFLIVCETEAKAEELREQINNGDLTFARAAATQSIGPERNNGGNLGEFSLDDLGPEWQQALTSIEDGQVAAPFALENGFALITKKSMVLGETEALEESRDRILRILQNEKSMVYMEELIEKLRNKAILEVRL